MNKWFNKFNKLTKVFIVIGMIAKAMPQLRKRAVA